MAIVDDRQDLVGRQVLAAREQGVGDFDALVRGDEVYYVEEMGDTGPTAAKVRVKASE